MLEPKKIEITREVIADEAEPDHPQPVACVHGAAPLVAGKKADQQIKGQGQRHAQGEQGFGVDVVTIGEFDQDSLERKADRAEKCE